MTYLGLGCPVTLAITSDGCVVTNRVRPLSGKCRYPFVKIEAYFDLIQFKRPHETKNGYMSKAAKLSQKARRN